MPSLQERVHIASHLLRKPNKKDRISWKKDASVWWVRFANGVCRCMLYMWHRGRIWRGSKPNARVWWLWLENLSFKMFEHDRSPRGRLALWGLRERRATTSAWRRRWKSWIKKHAQKGKTYKTEEKVSSKASSWREKEKTTQKEISKKKRSYVTWKANSITCRRERTRRHQWWILANTGR